MFVCWNRLGTRIIIRLRHLFECPASRWPAVTIITRSAASPVGSRGHSASLQDIISYLLVHSATFLMLRQKSRIYPGWPIGVTCFLLCFVVFSTLASGSDGSLLLLRPWLREYNACLHCGVAPQLPLSGGSVDINQNSAQFWEWKLGWNRFKLLQFRLQR